MPRAQRPRPAEELLAAFRVLAGGEDLAVAGVALVEGALAVDALHLVDRGRLAAIQAAASPGR